MSKKGIFGVEIKFNNEKIVDQEVNTIEEMDNLFNDIKKKFR